MGRNKIVYVNPADKSFTENTFLFRICEEYLLVNADDLDDALNEVGDWLKENAPEYLTEYGGDEHAALLEEACKELGIEFNPDKFCGEIDEKYAEAVELAEADLTYTEAGFLTAYEWGVWDNPSKEFLIQVAKQW